MAPLAMAMAAAACASGGGDRAELKPEAITPTEQWPIVVSQQADEIQLKAHPDGLSPAQEEALAELAMRWRSQAGGPITIQAPTVRGQAVAQASAADAQAMLIDLGAGPDQVRIAPYEMAGGQPPVLRVGFPSHKAAGAQCGDWENLTKTGQNRPYGNFGCAVSANIAAQVADPRHFLRPAPETPADATRRSVVLEKYRKGEDTSAAKGDISGVVSNAAGNQ